MERGTLRPGYSANLCQVVEECRTYAAVFFAGLATLRQQPRLVLGSVLFAGDAELFAARLLALLAAVLATGAELGHLLGPALKVDLVVLALHLDGAPLGKVHVDGAVEAHHTVFLALIPGGICKQGPSLDI